MGLCGSKAAVESTPVSHVGPQLEDGKPAGKGAAGQQHDEWAGKGKQKFALNQVVPLPPPKQQEQQQPVESSSTPSSTSDTPVVVVAAGGSGGGGATGNFAADLRRLCEQRVHGGQALAARAEQLHAAIKQGLGGFLRSCGQPTAAPELQRCASSAGSLCDAILAPVLAHIARVLSGSEASSSVGEAAAGPSWEAMEFADLLGVLEASCVSVYDLGVMEVGRPVALLLDLLHQLHQHCDARRITLPEGALRVAAVSELLSMVGIIFFRRVVLETAESAAAKLEDYQQLREQMGWADEHLAIAVDPQACAMLLYLQQVAAQGALQRFCRVSDGACMAWHGMCVQRVSGLEQARTTGKGQAGRRVCGIARTRLLLQPDPPTQPCGCFPVLHRRAPRIPHVFIHRSTAAGPAPVCASHGIHTRHAQPVPHHPCARSQASGASTLWSGGTPPFGTRWAWPGSRASCRRGRGRRLPAARSSLPLWTSTCGRCAPVQACLGPRCASCLAVWVGWGQHPTLRRVHGAGMPSACMGHCAAAQSNTHVRRLASLAPFACTAPSLRWRGT